MRLILELGGYWLQLQSIDIGSNDAIACRRRCRRRLQILRDVAWLMTEGLSCANIFGIFIVGSVGIGNYHVVSFQDQKLFFIGTRDSRPTEGFSSSFSQRCCRLLPFAMKAVGNAFRFR